MTEGRYVVTEVAEREHQFPVVALGGSAGALGAFFDFFDAVSRLDEPPEGAFVVILHLSPDEDSQLVDLLSHRTELPVSAVEARTEIEPGRVYVLPPDRTLDVAEGALVPRQRATGARHRPVDDILRGLAREFGARTTAIICSGTGTNGSPALGEVREAGGCVMVQTPETAEFDEMPRHAIETGFVDMVLEPSEMVPALVRNARRLARGYDEDEAGQDDLSRTEAPDRGPETAATEPEDQPQDQAFDRILTVLRARSSIDFRQYKTGTLFRRIDRRVHLLADDGWDAYADRIEHSPEEAEALLGELLITVTSFFRDEAAWQHLSGSVLKPLIKRRSGDEPIRIWVAGCATGEEAYSAVIALFEALRDEGVEPEPKVEIFATDASHRALSRARAGRYALAAVEHLPDEVIDRWFDRLDDMVQVRPALRDAMIFAPHNLVQDPPFSNADLVVCRNLLIYLKPEVQRGLVRLFHFALKEGGCLFLGSAESVGAETDLFETVDKSAHIWRRLGPTRHDLVDFPIIQRGRQRSAEPTDARPQVTARQQRPSEQAVTALAARYAPPSVVVDAGLNILYYHGEMSRYLRPQSGEATQNLLALARESVVPYLRRLIEAAGKSGRAETMRLSVALEDGEASVVLEAAPIPEASDRFTISFLEDGAAVEPERAATVPASSRERELENQVRVLREEIATATWSANHNLEESRAYNEEITSMNEELRASNEELETSKEELQSLNEELKTVNAQLGSTVSELRERTADLDNLMRSTGVATLFLDGELMVRWFSPSVAELFRIREADLGRPIGHVVRDVEDEALEEECRQVLRTLERHERNVTTGDGRRFARWIVPYRDVSDRIAGVVITFSDVTEIENARRHAERIVETVPMPLVVLDTELRVNSANSAFYRTFQVDPTHTENRLIYDLGNGQWNIPELRRLLSEVLPHDDVFRDYEVEHDFRDIGRRTMKLNGRRLDGQQLILLAIEDITERKRAEAHQEMLMGELAHRVKNALGVVQGLASQTLRRSTSLDEFRKAFLGRLAAYSRSHSQLLSRDWRSGTLSDLVEGAVEAHAVDPDRVTYDGPVVSLAAPSALALGLILHELETNAVKYGALSGAEGSVSITWALEDDGQVDLTWRERGGASVSPPDHEGFGSSLIRQFTSYQLNGEAELKFDRDGLVCHLRFPLPAEDEQSARNRERLPMH